MWWLLAVSFGLIGFYLLARKTFSTSLQSALSNPPRVRSHLEPEPGRLVCVVELADGIAPYFITAIHARRAEASVVGLQCPDGWVETPLSQVGSSDRAFFATWNEENIRFTGSLELLLKHPVRIAFPAGRNSNRIER
jgi:hypothetical protein